MYPQELIKLQTVKDEIFKNANDVCLFINYKLKCLEFTNQSKKYMDADINVDDSKINIINKQLKALLNIDKIDPEDIKKQIPNISETLYNSIHTKLTESNVQDTIDINKDTITNELMENTSVLNTPIYEILYQVLYIDDLIKKNNIPIGDNNINIYNKIHQLNGIEAINDSLKKIIELHINHFSYSLLGSMANMLPGGDFTNNLLETFQNINSSNIEDAKNFVTNMKDLITANISLQNIGNFMNKIQDKPITNMSDMFKSITESIAEEKQEQLENEDDMEEKQKIHEQIVKNQELTNNIHNSIDNISQVNDKKNCDTTDVLYCKIPMLVEYISKISDMINNFLSNAIGKIGDTLPDFDIRNSNLAYYYSFLYLSCIKIKSLNIQEPLPITQLKKPYRKNKDISINRDTKNSLIYIRGKLLSSHSAISTLTNFTSATSIEPSILFSLVKSILKPYTLYNSATISKNKFDINNNGFILPQFNFYDMGTNLYLLLHFLQNQQDNNLYDEVHKISVIYDKMYIHYEKTNVTYSSFVEQLRNIIDAIAKEYHITLPSCKKIDSLLYHLVQQCNLFNKNYFLKENIHHFRKHFLFNCKQDDTIEDIMNDINNHYGLFIVEESLVNKISHKSLLDCQVETEQSNEVDLLIDVTSRSDILEHNLLPDELENFIPNMDNTTIANYSDLEKLIYMCFPGGLDNFILGKHSFYDELSETIKINIEENNWFKLAKYVKNLIDDEITNKDNIIEICKKIFTKYNHNHMLNMTFAPNDHNFISSVSDVKEELLKKNQFIKLLNKLTIDLTIEQVNRVLAQYTTGLSVINNQYISLFHNPYLQLTEYMDYVDDIMIAPDETASSINIVWKDHVTQKDTIENKIKNDIINQVKEQYLHSLIFISCKMIMKNKKYVVGDTFCRGNIEKDLYIVKNFLMKHNFKDRLCFTFEQNTSHIPKLCQKIPINENFTKMTFINEIGCFLKYLDKLPNNIYESITKTLDQEFILSVMDVNQQNKIFEYSSFQHKTQYKIMGFSMFISINKESDNKYRQDNINNSSIMQPITEFINMMFEHMEYVYDIDNNIIDNILHERIKSTNNILKNHKNIKNITNIITTKFHTIDQLYELFDFQHFNDLYNILNNELKNYIVNDIQYMLILADLLAYYIFRTKLENKIFNLHLKVVLDCVVKLFDIFSREFSLALMSSLYFFQEKIEEKHIQHDNIHLQSHHDFLYSFANSDTKNIQNKNSLRLLNDKKSQYYKNLKDKQTYDKNRTYTIKNNDNNQFNLFIALLPVCVTIMLSYYTINFFIAKNNPELEKKIKQLEKHNLNNSTVKKYKIKEKPETIMVA